MEMENVVLLIFLYIAAWPACTVASSWDGSVPAVFKDQYVKSNLGLTYDSKRGTDGAGAQLQRMMGLYAISQFLGIRFLHSPLDPQHVIKQTAERWGQVLRLGDDGQWLNATWIKLYAEKPAMEDLERIALEVQKNRTSVLVVSNLPFAIVDRLPDVWYSLQPAGAQAYLSNQGGQAASPQTVATHPSFRLCKIAVHMRRGDLFAIDPSRMLSNSYYVTILKALTQHLASQHVAYVVNLFTEAPECNSSVVVGGGGGSQPVKVTREMLRLEDFDQVPHLQLQLNKDVVWTMQVGCCASCKNRSANCGISCDTEPAPTR
jgi:hypothetical protein